jgi:polyisoprenoid-binding protein YceI
VLALIPRSTRCLALLFGTGLAALGQSSQYPIQPGGDNRLELRVYKTGLYKGKVHVFAFPSYSGVLTYDSRSPGASTASLRLAAAEIKLLDTWLSAKDFRSVQEYALKDMLNTAKFPEIAFDSSEIRALDAARFEVRGTLTIRGVGKAAVVSVTLQSGDRDTLRLDGKATVKLTDFGLKPPSAALGLIGTRDEMDFAFQFALSRAGN